MNRPSADLDRQARAAARRFHDDVADTVDLDVVLDDVRQPRRPVRPGAVLAIAAVIALVAVGLVIRPDGDREVEVALEETTTSTTTTQDRPAPDDGVVPAPGIALGGPTDGKDSVGLPVSVEPATGLIEGQTVTVTGAQFPPSQSVGVVMCTKEAGRDHGARGADACNIGHFAQGTTDAQGNVSVEFQVRRLATLDGEEVDCASEPGRCIVGMGLLSDYDQSGGFAIEFDPDVELADPPTVELAKTTDLVDGETVAATITGLFPNSSLFIEQCSADGFRCVQVAGELAADAQGSFDGGIRLWRNFGTYTDPTAALPPNVDCALEACTVRIGADVPSGRIIPSVDVTFDGSRGARSAPTVSVSPAGPYRPGDTLTVTVEDATPGAYTEASICSRTDGFCIGGSGDQSSGDTVVVTVKLDLQFQGVANACASGCILIVNQYSETAPASGPPPLFPDPIPIDVVD